jgi:hypothetical protein
MCSGNGRAGCAVARNEADPYSINPIATKEHPTFLIAAILVEYNPNQ